MNALSAIRQYITQDVRHVASVPKAGEIPTSGKIGEADLKSLSSTSAAGDAQSTAGIKEAGGSFGDIFTRLVQDVNTKQVSANDAVNGLVSGDNASLHKTVIAMEEANVSFQLMVEVRNKLLESYQELMRMQV